MLRLEIAGMLDMRKLIATTYELEGNRLEVLLVFDRLQMLRTIGNGLRAKQGGLLPNVDAVLRALVELKQGVEFEKHFDGHGKVVGKLVKKEDVESTLYPGTARPAWLCRYADVWKGSELTDRQRCWSRQSVVSRDVSLPTIGVASEQQSWCPAS